MRHNLSAGKDGHYFRQLLFRHLAVAALGEAGCHLALHEGGRAAAAVECRLGRMEQYAQEVFGQTVGRDPELKAKLIERTEKMNGRVNILAWTNQMPQLMLTNGPLTRRLR